MQFVIHYLSKIPKKQTKKLIIVGNGVINEEFGTLIDSYDRIIRINDFKIKGYEKFVGTKIDIVSYFPNNKANPLIYQANEVWYLFSKKKVEHNKHFLEVQNKKNGFIEKWINEINNVPGMFIYNNGTAGFYTLHMAFILMYDQYSIDLIGFDHGKSGHYYNPNHIHAKNHNWNLEEKIINQYISKGFIRNLNPKFIKI